MSSRPGPQILARHVTVQVKGTGLEEFINQCVRHGIRLWEVERPAKHILIVRMQARDFPLLRRVASQATWQARIIRRHGGGFLLVRLMRRPSFLLGGLLAALLWYGLSSYIWFVKVEGVDRVAPERVLEVATEAGVSRGVLAESIDPDRVQRTLLLSLEELVWVGVEVRGTQAVIRVAERRTPELSAQGPGHIVAARDGVIERISVLRGVPAVEPGDTVRAGQLLISGEMRPGSPEFQEQIAQGQLPYLRAAGSVHALVWYEGEAEAVVGSAGIEQAKANATEVALALANDQLAAAQGEETGEPLIEVEEDAEGQRVRVRVLIQGIQQISQFEPVLP